MTKRSLALFATAALSAILIGGASAQTYSQSNQDRTSQSDLDQYNAGEANDLNGEQYGANSDSDSQNADSDRDRSELDLSNRDADGDQFDRQASNAYDRDRATDDLQAQNRDSSDLQSNGFSDGEGGISAGDQNYDQSDRSQSALDDSADNDNDNDTH